jgi:carboxyl-terminal processing protease
MKRLLASWIMTVLVVGCASNTTVPQKPEAEPDVVQAPAGIPASNTAQMCADATASHAVTATSVSVDGGVNTEPGRPIHATVVTNGCGDVLLSAKWTWNNKVLIVKTDQPIRSLGPATTKFRISDPQPWPLGTYRVEIDVDGVMTAAKEFSMTSHGLVVSPNAVEVPSLVSTTNAQDANALLEQGDMADAANIIFHLSKFNFPTNFTQNPNYGNQVLLRYMNNLDPEHLFFSSKDQAEVLITGKNVPSLIQSRNIAYANDIATRHANRVKFRIDYALALVDKGFSFNGNDTIVINVPSTTSFLSDQELDARWAKIVKSDWLNLKLDGLSNAQIKERLLSRYRHFSDALVEADRSTALWRYVQACIGAGDPGGSYDNVTHFGSRNASDYLFERLRFEDDADGPIIRVGSGDVADASIQDGDRLIAASVGGGPVTDMLGLTATAAVKQLTSLSQSGALTLFIRRANTAPGAPIIEIPYGIGTGLPAQRVKTRFVQPVGARVDERVAVITVPLMYGFTNRKGDGTTSDARADVDLRQALDEATSRHAVAVILDLRGNSGGYMDTVARATREFLGDRLLWRVQSHTGITPQQKELDGPVAWDGPLTVLVDGSTAEGGEMFAGALQDYGRALVVGNKTWGDGNIEVMLDLNRFVTTKRVDGSDLGILKMTVQSVFRADGNSVTGRGVEPDIVLPSLGEDRGWFKATPIASIAPVAADGFPEFDAADKQVALKYQHVADNAPDINQWVIAEHRIEPDGQMGGELSLNLARRQSERRAAKHGSPAPTDDPVITKVVEIAYDQSQEMAAHTARRGQ